MTLHMRFLAFLIILLMPLASAQAQSTCEAPTVDLERGDTDALTNGQVSVLQQFLVTYEKANKVKLSGRYDTATEAAVKRFQRKHDISTSGFSGNNSKLGEVVGPITRAVMENVCEKATKNSSKAKKSDGLETKVYKTPAGVPVIRQPKGWNATPFDEFSDIAEGYVYFTNPKKAVGMQVGVGGTVDQYNDTPEEMINRIVGLYGGSGTFQGKILKGKVVKKTPITISGARGYMLEMTRTDLGGDWRIKYMPLVKGNKYYEVSAKVPKKEWNKVKDILDASFRTIQIP